MHPINSGCDFMGWTSPSSYAVDVTSLDRLVADAAARHLNEALSEVGMILDISRDAGDPDQLRDGIDRGLDAMTAYIAVDAELRRLRRGDAPVSVVATLEAICAAHRGIPGIEAGVRFEAIETDVKAVAEPTAAWVASVALVEMVRELSRRGPVRVGVSVRGREVTILATAPAGRISGGARRSTPTTPFLRRLAHAVDAKLTRRAAAGRRMLCLTIPSAPTRRMAVPR